MATCLDLLQHLKHSPLNKKRENIKLVKLKRNFFGPAEWDGDLSAKASLTQSSPKHSTFTPSISSC